MKNQIILMRQFKLFKAVLITLVLLTSNMLIAQNFGQKHKFGFNGEYGTGIQTNTLYSRSASNFAWFRGGTHNDNELSSGEGGNILMALNLVPTPNDQLNDNGFLNVHGGINAKEIYFNGLDLFDYVEEDLNNDGDFDDVVDGVEERRAELNYEGSAAGWTLVGHDYTKTDKDVKIFGNLAMGKLDFDGDSSIEYFGENKDLTRGSVRTDFTNGAFRISSKFGGSDFPDNIMSIHRSGLFELGLRNIENILDTNQASFEIYYTNQNFSNAIFLGTPSNKAIHFFAQGITRMSITEIGDVQIGNNAAFYGSGPVLIQNATKNDPIANTTIPSAVQNFGLLVKDGLLTEDLAIDAEENWGADYVFDNDYTPITLNELETYITTNKHLPGVIGAAEAVNKGYYDVDDMIIGQLKNLEEQILHNIAQEKKIKAQQEEITQLKTSLQTYETRLKKLEVLLESQKK